MPKPFAVFFTFAVLAALLAVLLMLSLLPRLFSEKPVCGNRLLEAGESPQNCCEDTGCLPSQSCTDHSCLTLSCGYCEYAANEICNRYACCADAECKQYERCVRNECAAIACDCGYVRDRACVNYECCSNSDCLSGVCQGNKCAALVMVKQKPSSDGEIKVVSGGSAGGSGVGAPAQADPQPQQQPPQPQQPQQQACTPSPEICDGVDNDCSGLVDDGITCECSPGHARSCGYSNVGLCRLGTQTCQGSHLWGVCAGNVGPAAETCDGKDNNCDGKVDEGSLCQQGQLCISGGCKAVNPAYQVQPVIFFPTDYASDQAMVSYLNGKFGEIRQFYLSKTGATFTILPTKVIAGNNNHAWYWCRDSQPGCINSNFEANVMSELKSNGLPVEGDWNIYPYNKVTWVVAFGGGGYAGGRSYPTGGGFAMVGDAGIYAAKDKSCSRLLDYYYSPHEPNNIKGVCKNSWLPSGKEEGFGIGALGHELGHAFKLPHPDGYPGTTAQDWDKTLMGNHWNYPDTGLLQQDKDILAQSPYFNSAS